MTEVENLLFDLLFALDHAFISSWQSTASWSEQLEAARKYFENKENDE
jgi:hypothetical protein